MQIVEEHNEPFHIGRQRGSGRPTQQTGGSQPKPRRAAKRKRAKPAIAAHDDDGVVHDQVK